MKYVLFHPILFMVLLSKDVNIHNAVNMQQKNVINSITMMATKYN